MSASPYRETAEPQEGTNLNYALHKFGYKKVRNGVWSR